MTKRRKRVCVLLAALALTVWVLWANTALETNAYVIRSSRVPEAFSGFRIVQVSDLHNARFGQGNQKLLKLIDNARPDIIVITGDLVDSRNTDIDVALEFVRSAGAIAPVYYVNGNHESRIDEYAELEDELIQAGVTVLRNDSLRLERAGETITLIGMDDPDFHYRAPSEILAELTAETEGYTVLLSHRPELFDSYVSCGIDLVFTGHAHGGQFRLPLVGGLIAPHQGLFPKYDAGLYTGDATHMLVSRGVGNSVCPIRFNNRPEIIVAELESAS